ncbi:MAG: PEPxxWA-CTERM sorting domain-containing protein [Sphingomicrobium sp.]
MTLAAAGAALAIAAPATAAITITASPGAVQPDENVLANTNVTGTTVFGGTNQTNTSVSIASTNGETLTSTTSNGQSRFSSTDGSLDMARIFLTQGGTFTSAEFNLFNALSTTSSVSIIVNGIAQSFALGNGQNFFGIQATGGDVISSIAFDTNGIGVADLRQLRLGGVAAVPEPATWALMLIGFGGMGIAMRRGRRRSGKLLKQLA